MKAYRIHLTSWTASFRYPNLISGYQPSLVVPPLATIYGLISAAAGDYISAKEVSVGYVYSFGCQTVELETIYQFSSKSSRLITKPNVMRRQILFDNSLWLYLSNSRVADFFYKPYFQLLLGRSNDLASVQSIEQIDIQPLAELTKLRGTSVPVGNIPLAAPIQALPVSFTNEIPRRSMGTRPFFLLEYDYVQPEALPGKGFLDPQLDHEIYWHDYTE
ncbi:MAG: type I-B CRISPR-associated protein Cas5 [Deltaproteobacteria bacterium]|nr:type I-B CRISPR-associated protein Cas5 [Deltaproteobacteria bacterium]PXF55602.1 MAG: type I-B CRISPR-associated protein Cas5 [Deltaproteobacteria bacterium]HDH86762.1 type I-B CRISPR-associated protein Cas5 [Desulfobacteraceae bacterium]